MRDKKSVQLLIQELQNDLTYIQENHDLLERAKLRLDSGGWSDELDLMVMGAALHGIYNSYEAYFLRIAKYFENSIDQQAWHRDLLDRMSFDIPDVRPALLTDPEIVERLDELMRFRHLFRNLYKTRLKGKKLQIVFESAEGLDKIFIPMHEDFISWLKKLTAKLDE